VEGRIGARERADVDEFRGEIRSTPRALVKQGIQLFGGAGQGALAGQERGTETLDRSGGRWLGLDKPLWFDALAARPPEKDSRQGSGSQSAGEGEPPQPPVPGGWDVGQALGDALP
jgi:hypothetical protein